MTPQNYVNAYRSARNHSSKTHQVVMLYEAAIAALLGAKAAMEAKDSTERFNQLEKVNAIMDGLQSSIDFDQGQDVAHVLHDFYSGIMHGVDKLQRHDMPELYDKLMLRLREMLESWKQIDAREEAKSNAGASAGAASSSLSGGGGAGGYQSSAIRADGVAFSV